MALRARTPRPAGLTRFATDRRFSLPPPAWPPAIAIVVSWTHWHNEPLLVGALILAAWAYVLGTAVWRFRLAPNEAFPRAAAWRFGAGLVVFYLAVGSPLDQIGERFLLSAHMVQHMIIVYLAAPLVLTGLPVWLVDAALARSGIRAVVRVLTRPVVAAVLFALCMAFWHVPAAYDHALRVKVVHVAQHLSFFAAALLMWWPLLSPSRLLPRLPAGARILYVFALGVLQTPLAAFLTFSREVLYPTYEFAPRLTPLGPLEDQILGGTLMTVGGMFIALGLIAWAFFVWHRESEADPAQRDG
jgi:putative membrane protein